MYILLEVLHNRNVSDKFKSQIHGGCYCAVKSRLEFQIMPNAEATEILLTVKDETSLQKSLSHKI